MNNFTTGRVFTYSDFEAMKIKRRKNLLVVILSLLMAFFLFKDAFALYSTIYINGQKAYRVMDTGQVIAPRECKCD